MVHSEKYAHSLSPGRVEVLTQLLRGEWGEPESGVLAKQRPLKSVAAFLSPAGEFNTKEQDVEFIHHAAGSWASFYSFKTYHKAAVNFLFSKIFDVVLQYT